jgi:hypothetical protein
MQLTEHVVDQVVVVVDNQMEQILLHLDLVPLALVLDIQEFLE